MLSFSMDIETALEFWERVTKRKAETEEARTRILLELMAEGKMNTVIQTNRTKEEYIEDLKKNFNILEVKDENK